jgi:hypothetical protein
MINLLVSPDQGLSIESSRTNVCGRHERSVGFGDFKSGSLALSCSEQTLVFQKEASSCPKMDIRLKLSTDEHRSEDSKRRKDTVCFWAVIRIVRETSTCRKAVDFHFSLTARAHTHVCLLFLCLNESDCQNSVTNRIGIHIPGPVDSSLHFLPPPPVNDSESVDHCAISSGHDFASSLCASSMAIDISMISLNERRSFGFVDRLDRIT